MMSEPEVMLQLKSWRFFPLSFLFLIIFESICQAFFISAYKSKLSTCNMSNINSLPGFLDNAFAAILFIDDFLENRGTYDFIAKYEKFKVDKIFEYLTLNYLLILFCFVLFVPLELDDTIKEAFDVAYDKIYAFHLAQKSPEKSVKNMKGAKCKRVARTRSIAFVGLYVPGDTVVLPSITLMLAILTHITGCKIIVLTTPPSQNGNMCKEVLYYAKKGGVTHIFKAGGGQAISVMAWGTKSCPNEAMVSIDMLVGPLEVLVIAEKHACPVHITTNLLSQAEHGPDSQVVLVVVGDGVDLKAVKDDISKQCQSLSRREYASISIFAHDMVEAISFSNLYAPEHLIINVKDAEKWESFIENWTPKSIANYASGTNHVLPTYGYVRVYREVSLDSFVKYITVQSLIEKALSTLGPYVATIKTLNFRALLSDLHNVP
ncbi:hypothetical protein K2173_016187 [Erythroxylum novogranatense]|uniref:Histidinol dehydrogenase n=1 Tax=Erythroxylum novogranatense TaxID=1862640 RepID=A0AAV8SG77_9ROSI|nr:hypothetical protein K2173_016187 [Erythroxylum novogranatense]